MSKQLINTSTANSGTGDNIRDAFIKTNNNFTELYGLIGAENGIINFTSLADAPSSYTANQIIMAGNSGPLKLTARTLQASGAISINTSNPSTVVFTVSQFLLKDDPYPTISTALDAAQNPIGRLSDPSIAVAAAFNLARSTQTVPVTTKISELPVTVNYGFEHYIPGTPTLADITGLDTSTTQRSASSYAVDVHLYANAGLTGNANTSIDGNYTAFYNDIYTTRIKQFANTLIIGDPVNGTGSVSIIGGSGGISIGGDSVAKTISIGNSVGTSGLNISSGSNGTTLSSSGAINLYGSTNINIGDASATLAISVGNTISTTRTYIKSGTGGISLSGSGAINIGNDAVAKTITIGNATGNTSISVNAGTGGISLSGSGAINIGNDADAKTITIGNATGNTSISVNAGTGGISIGNDAVAKTITIGNATGNTSISVNAGTGGISIGNDAVAKTITIGNTTGATTISLNTGTSGTVSSNGQITSTVADGTPPFVVTSTTPVDNLSIGGTAGNVSGIVGVSNGGTGSAYGATNKLEQIQVMYDANLGMVISLANTRMDFESVMGALDDYPNIISIDVISASVTIPHGMYFTQQLLPMSPSTQQWQPRLVIHAITDGTACWLGATADISYAPTQIASRIGSSAFTVDYVGCAINTTFGTITITSQPWGWSSGIVETAILPYGTLASSSGMRAMIIGAYQGQGVYSFISNIGFDNTDVTVTLTLNGPNSIGSTPLFVDSSRAVNNTYWSRPIGIIDTSVSYSYYQGATYYPGTGKWRRGFNNVTNLSFDKIAADLPTFGSSQSWYTSPTLSRIFNTWYYNLTNRPIQVVVHTSSNVSTFDIYSYPGDTIPTTIATNNTFFVIVPPFYGYKVGVVAGTTLVSWAEYR